MTLQSRNLDHPDEVRKFNNGEFRVVTLPGTIVGRAVFQPDWRWSNDVKPVAGTDSCQAAHTGYIVSGRMHVVMDDGAQLDIGPDSVFEIPPGHDKWVVGDATWDTIEWGASARAFGAGAEVDFDRVLATVLFTDIVGSTQVAARMGDRAWRDLVASHHKRVRSLLARFRGREVDVAGDGFLAVFDGPARAVRCGLAICEDARALGFDVRVGVHTGEVELDGPALRGIAVHIGARVAAEAAPADVLVTSTVKDLVAGSGLVFTGHSQRELKGVPGAWNLYSASAPESGTGP